MQFKIHGVSNDIEEGLLNERAACGIEDSFWQRFQERGNE
jgi:hypothetical protein